MLAKWCIRLQPFLKTIPFLTDLYLCKLLILQDIGENASDIQLQVAPNYSDKL